MSWRYEDPTGLDFDKSPALLWYERKITKQSSIMATKSLPSHLCHDQMFTENPEYDFTPIDCLNVYYNDFWRIMRH